jgi:hypothetical protein
MSAFTIVPFQALVGKNTNGKCRFILTGHFHLGTREYENDYLGMHIVPLRPRGCGFWSLVTAF